MHNRFSVFKSLNYCMSVGQLWRCAILTGWILFVIVLSSILCARWLYAVEMHDQSLGLSGVFNSPFELPSGWVQQTHPKVKQATQILRQQLDGETVLQIKSDAGYGTWVKRFETPVVIDEISWRWAVHLKPNQANLKQKNADDAALKFCVFIEVDETKIGFLNRLALQTARTLSGLFLPAGTLCYVWADQNPVGEVFPSPYTPLVMNWVLQNQPASTQWVSEHRNLINDARIALGSILPLSSEGKPIVRVQGVAIGGDADNTQSSSLAFFADLKVKFAIFAESNR